MRFGCMKALMDEFILIAGESLIVKKEREDCA